ncbi:MAG: DNA repair protein RecN [Bacteroidetes bacterium]|jgi:DNA repair protein RecN (Recombination protein N)|nr:DNA repair protein RecN [Bacteroidota bacterium]MBT6688023.1 DNA repair protein RecN [Bacteroidota bacterium]MBT7144813.1 DNA repair protein RecN [Bacteroidota bacterium]MBT7492404.1 DNA repair protein RecN [Bacteroidota bacterium]
MLKSLIIKNYTLIEHLEIDFNNGFSIITGETGAGKSIIIGALSLLFGQRAESSIIKSDTKKCIIEGEFSVSEFKLDSFFSENDIDNEQVLLIRREINSNGKSRAFINDTPVNINILKTLRLQIIDIHSQHQNLLLNNTNFQLQLIDSFSKQLKAISNFQSQYFRLQELKKKHKTLKETEEKSAKELDYLLYQLNELEKANLQTEEQENFEKELETLNHAEEINLNFAEAEEILLGSNAVLSQLKKINNNIDKTIKYVADSAELYKRIESCFFELKDVGDEIEKLNSNIEIDPEKIDFIKQRLDLIYNLQLKHRVNSVSELLDIQDKLKAHILKISSFDEEIQILEKEIFELEKKTVNSAMEISENRKKAIPSIENKITEMLKLLGMPDVEFKIELSDKPELSETGFNNISLLFSANKMIALQDITKVASGGEISRVMLSIKALLAKSLVLPTIVFDEIDSGISSEIASKMGDILKNMSEQIQVINITHLPQIAAKGDIHYYVFKNAENKRTTTKIKILNHKERIEEIAKMLSGESVSDAAFDNARELLKN